MRKALFLLAVTAGAVFAQPSIFNTPWWESKIAVNSMNLSETQTKQLTAIQQASRGRLEELRGSVMKAETNLSEIYNQPEIDLTKADAAVDQYANARENLTRALTLLSLKMRSVLTQEQWQALENRQAGRAVGRGPGRGRRGTAPSGSGPNSTTNKISPPPIPQK